MRSSIIIASIVALAAALPAIVPVEKTALAVRTESLEATAAVEARQSSAFDETYSWPDTEVYGSTLAAQFLATNQGNGKYTFQFWDSAPANNGALNYRVSSGGKTLASVNLVAGQTSTVTVPKTGSNFNVVIQLA